MVDPTEADVAARESNGGGDDSPLTAGVSCSICLELVLDNVDRSRAKLQCGHEFHLDCIGSAFNMKGSMQCQNCRQVEKGRWLYASGGGSSRSMHELSMDDMIPDEDFHYFGHPEMHYRFRWCPFGELARHGSSFEEVESPSTTYHASRGFHSGYARNTATSSVAHSNVASAGPPVPAIATETSDTSDEPNLNDNWNGLSGHNGHFSHRLVPALNVHYHGRGGHVPPFLSNSHVNDSDPAAIPHMTMRPSSAEYDARMRSTAFTHPFLFGYRSGPVSSGSLVSSAVPRHPFSHTHERIQISHAFHHRLQSTSLPGMPSPVVVHGIGRFEGSHEFSTAVTPVPQQDPGGGFFVVPSSIGLSQYDGESSLPNHFHAW